MPDGDFDVPGGQGGRWHPLAVDKDPGGHEGPGAGGGMGIQSATIR